jgi:fumarate reductase subunit C
MLRELTSVVVAGYAVFLVVLVTRAAEQQSFASLYRVLQSPASIALHLLALLAVLYHSITWIALTPKILVIHREYEQVSPRLVAVANYLAWAATSALVAWLVLR